MHHHRPASFPRWTHQEDQRQHSQEDNRQQPEDIVERHDGGLLADDVLDLAISHALSGGGIGAALHHQHALHSIDEALGLRAGGRHMRR